MVPTSSAKTLHPYYPVGLHLPHYVASDTSVAILLLSFTLITLGLFGITLSIVYRLRPSLPVIDRACILWFVLCGSLHIFFEGYFVINNYGISSTTDLFGSLWKEYALSDSRYLTSDTLVLCMEATTSLIWGPLSYLTAYMIFHASPHRYSVQLIVSTAHIYGDTLYYATSLYDFYMKNISYCRPEGYYFWGYYILMNCFWILVPAYLVFESLQNIASAFQSVKNRHEKKKIG